MEDDARMSQSFTTTALGEKVREWRRARGMSQPDLAEAAGVDQSFISHVETGRNREPAIEYLRKIAKGLDIPLSVLLLAGELITPEEMGVNDDPELVEMIAIMRQDSDFLDSIRRLGGANQDATLRNVVASMRMQIRAILEDRERQSNS